MKRAVLLPVVFIFTLSLLLQRHANASISLNPGATTTQLNALADDDPSSGAPVTDSSSPTVIPSSDSFGAVDVNGTQANSNYSFTNTLLPISFTLEHSDTGDALARASGEIWFTVDDPIVDYTLSGQLSVMDADLGGGPKGKNVLLTVDMVDMTLGGLFYFENTQRSNNTANEFFTLGGTGGDAENILSGSLTGQVAASSAIRLRYTAEISNLDELNVNSGAAQATGFLNLNVIPEPSTALLSVLGIVGLAASRRRRSDSSSV